MIKENGSSQKGQGEERASVPRELTDYKLFMQLFIEKLPKDQDSALTNQIELMMHRAYYSYMQLSKSDSSGELLELIHNISSPKDEAPITSKYHLADRCKTNFTKIIWAMYEMRMIQTSNGLFPTNKQELMEDFGKFLHTDLSDYSTLLSRSKAQDKEDGFLEVAKTIERSLRGYYLKSLTPSPSRKERGVI